MYTNLLKCVSINENMPIVMKKWFTRTDCGTVGCLLGNYLLGTKKDWGKYEVDLFDCKYDEFIAEFGITEYEFAWLFAQGAYSRSNDEYITRKRDLALVSREQALGRLRKFLYYKMHKAEMIVEVGRNKRIEDAGRYISGNQAAVKASVCETLF